MEAASEMVKSDDGEVIKLGVELFSYLVAKDIGNSEAIKAASEGIESAKKTIDNKTIELYSTGDFYSYEFGRDYQVSLFLKL